MVVVFLVTVLFGILLLMMLGSSWNAAAGSPMDALATLGSSAGALAALPSDVVLLVVVLVLVEMSMAMAMAMARREMCCQQCRLVRQ